MKFRLLRTHIVVNTVEALDTVAENHSSCYIFYAVSIFNIVLLKFFTQAGLI